MPKLDVDLDLRELTRRVRPYFSETILKRGWKYYKDGYVANLRLEQPATLQAKVYGTSTYRVRLDLRSFAASSCSCPYGDYCKHMAAVLFQALEQAGLPPKDFLSGVAATTPASSAERVGVSAPDRFFDRNSQPQSIQAARQGLPQESDSSEAWQRYFKKTFGKPNAYGHYAIESYYEKGRKHLFSLSQNWNPLLQHLFRIQAWLFLLEQIDSMYEQLAKYYFYSDNFPYYQRISAAWLQDLELEVDQLDKQEAFERHKSHLLAIVDFLQKTAFPRKNTLADWSYIYRFLWGRLLSRTSWMESEREWLVSELAQHPASPFRRDLLLMAQVHFDILEGNDRQAMDRVETEISTIEPAWFWGYLQGFLLTEAGDRLLSWLEWLKPLLKNSDARSLYLYLAVWRQLRQKHAAESQWEQTLIDLLPGSFEFYAAHLLEREQYREWVDLHLYYEISLPQADPASIKQVEKADPSLVLPLYHQTIDRFIQEKNRDAYKQAVRLMKKLERHYRQIKQQSEWGRFLQHVTSQFARYRALQEELKKGKLIP